MEDSTIYVLTTIIITILIYYQTKFASIFHKIFIYTHEIYFL